jgi:hypothetical protein
VFVVRDGSQQMRSGHCDLDRYASERRHGPEFVNET